MFSKLTIIISALALFFLWSFDVSAGIIRKPPINLGLVGYWSFDVGKGGLTAVDQSGNGNTGTLTNMDAGSDWVDGKLGQALDFDGSNDYVSIGDNDTLDLASEVSVSLWFKADGTSWKDAYQSIIAKRTSTTNYGMNVRGGATDVFQWYFLSTPNGIVDIPASGINLGVWVHVVGTFTDTGADVEGKIYINGALQKTETFTDANLPTNNTPVTIGVYGTNSEPFDGQIDEVRIYNRALSAAEVARLYRLRKPKILAPNNNGLVGYWSFNEGAGGYAGDFSGNGNSGTLTNMDASSDWVDGKLGQALDFDGSNDYVSVVSGTAPASAVSIGAWIYPTNASVSDSAFGDMIFHWGVKTGCNPSSQMLYIKSNTLNFRTGCGTTLMSASSTQNNTWYYDVVTIDSSGNATLYIDGVAVAGPTNTRSGQSVSTGNDKIGAVHNANNLESFFGGKIDEVRIYNRALSAAEVARLYNTGLAKINSSTKGQLTNGLVGHWTFDGPDLSFTTNLATDVSGNGNNGRLTNMSTSSSPTIGKLGQALDFDGSDDYVSVPDSTSLDTGSTFSVSAWIKPNALSARYGIFSTRRNNDSGSWQLEYGTPGSGTCTQGCVSVTGVNTFINVSPNGIAGINEWSFVTYVHPSGAGAGSMYINGVLQTPQTSNTYTISDNNSAKDVGQGTSNTQRFSGLIDEVRIYNRALSASEVKRLYNLGR